MARKRQNNHNMLKSGLAIAALGSLTLAACPAEAQFGNIVNPIAPRVLPLGGPVLQFGMANQSFNGSIGQFSGFNQFNGANQFSGFNQLNAPSSAFRQPRTIIDPSVGIAAQLNTSGQPVDTSFFFANNPGISPFLANGSVNGNFGINSFNTGAVGFNSFNTLNNGVNSFNGSFNNGFNTGFNGSFNNGGLTTSALLNNQLNAQAQPQHIFRPAPAFNPTLPNPAASQYAPVSTPAMLAANMANMNTQAVNGVNGVNRPYPYNLRVIDWPVPNTPSTAPSTTINNNVIGAANNGVNNGANLIYPYNTRMIDWPVPNTPMPVNNVTTVNRWFLNSNRMIGAQSPVIRPMGSSIGSSAGFFSKSMGATAQPMVMGGRSR